MSTKVKEALRTKTRRRQWGTERRTEPLPRLHAKPPVRKVASSRLAIILTVALWILYVLSTIIRQFFDGAQGFRFTMEAVGYLIVMTFLTFSALMYLISRQGAFERFSKHARVPRAELERYFSTHQPNITVLVPSYNEEPTVVRKTLLSAALQEYPSKRIVLLIDDNPKPATDAAADRLAGVRALATQITDLFAEPRKRFTALPTTFEQHYLEGAYVNPHIVKEVAGQYMWAADWLGSLADREVLEDHVDVFFAEQVLRRLADDLRLVGDALMVASNERARLPARRVLQLCYRLAWIFSVEIATFERKQYVSLSQESNKAMNINSYIGLMGHSYRRQITPDGLVLVPVKRAGQATVTFPDTEYLLTLDADSVLLRDYCLRLVYYLEQPANKRVAVTQTPYSSFRGAGTRIERLAGATTDVQHILHQGLSQYGATFWVGANAVIRKKALEDIAESEWIGGFEIKRYIQDRTVIEDTESSIDLAMHGWTLVNYPERLSYSATPPDFGSLIIQRRRWANGGLLILPKFLAQIRARKARGELVSKTEILLRLNYLASIAWSSFGLVFLLAFPYDSRLLSPLVLLAALPYFLAMASDLKYNGYKRTDIFRIYGFNLILLPINLAGVFKSLEQALTGKKIAFARTPKVKNHTVSPLLYVVVPVLIVAFSIFTVWRNAIVGNWGNAAVACFNALVALWAIVACIGIGNILVDTWIGLTNWMYVTKYPKPAHAPKDTQPALDWRAVLYHGEAGNAIPLAAQDIVQRAPRLKREQVVADA